MCLELLSMYAISLTSKSSLHLRTSFFNINPTERDEMEAALRGDSLEDQEALRRTYSSSSLRGRGRSDMSELGLGGAEDGRTPPRSPRHDRSKSPYNRAATAGY